MFISPKALRKSGTDSPTNLSLFHLQNSTLHEEHAHFGHAAHSGLQWMKGMNDMKRQTEGIQSLQGPKLREIAGHYIVPQFSPGLLIGSKWMCSV